MSEFNPLTAVNSVEKSIHKMIETVEQLPEETIRWNPSAEEWSIMQIMAHVAEALPFWINEINKIINDPQAIWERTMDHEERLYAVSEENINRLTVDKAINDLKSTSQIVKETVSTLTTEQLAIVASSNNPRLDGESVQSILEHHIVEHVEKHNDQIQRNLNKRSKQK